MFNFNTTSQQFAIFFVLGDVSSQHATRPCGGSTNPFSSNPFGQPSTATTTATGVPHQIDTGNPFSESNLILILCIGDESHHFLLFFLPDHFYGFINQALILIHSQIFNNHSLPADAGCVKDMPKEGSSSPLKAMLNGFFYSRPSMLLYPTK